MLTPQQQKALDFERHLSVTANAGAGKTTVLVQRFLEILTRTPTRVNEIVAITFTEKAANELRKKIAEKIEERLRHAAPPERVTFEAIRDQLSSATIGTIHSFCAQLLRAFPVEADIDAAFTVLEGVDQRILQEEALQETFEDIMGDTDTVDDRNALLDLVRLFGRPTVQHYVHVLLEKREQIERLLSGVFADEHGDEDILERWRHVLLRDAEWKLTRYDWRSAVLNICSAAGGQTAAHVAGLTGSFDAEAALPARLEGCKNILDLVFTRKASLRKSFAGTGSRDAAANSGAEVLARFYREILSLSEEILHPAAIEANMRLLAATRSLLRVFRRCTEIYEKRKSELGLLDFEDLQLKTRTLLQRLEISERLKQKYKFIMVDEFQDTNRLQYEIFRLLIDRYASGNLFIVGDPKQSIYGFRNAEVEVFEEAKQEITSAHNVRLPDDPAPSPSSTLNDERRGAVVLSESFRPLSNLIAFVNTVFHDLMGEPFSPFDVPYDDLIQGRANNNHGEVELLLVSDAHRATTAPAGEAAGQEDNVTAECRMIAQRLAELRNTKHQIHEDDEQGSSREFEFRDAAILLRDRRNVRAIERALSELHVPYVLLGGIGFYQTQEVNDVLNHFKFLLNPNDDVALAGILRSPLYALSDAELFEISLVRDANSFWEKMRMYALRPEASESAHRAVATLTDTLTVSHRLTIPQLAERIFRRTGWHGTTSGLVSGALSAANIKKLLRIAREFEAKGYTTLYDFVERLKTLVAEQEREGQASLRTLNNSVQVLTIHSAKGLEFPVVFLPFMHKPFRYNDPPFIESGVGIGFRTKGPSQPEKERSSALFEYLDRRSREKTESEEKRIFYVACTRARDMLVLSGHKGERLPAASYLTWLLRSLPGDAFPEAEGTHLLPPRTLTMLHKAEDEFRTESVPYRLALTLRFAGAGDRGEPVSQKERPDDAMVSEFLIKPLAAQTSGEFYSATQVKTFLDCPSKYFLKYTLGVPEQYAVAYNLDEHEEGNDTLPGDVEGLITHAVLQELRSASVTDDEIRNKVRDFAALHHLEPAGSNGEGVESIANSVIRFKNSAFGAEMLSAPEAYTEVPVNATFDNDFLTGTIDRLIRDSHANWNIIDYKTDNVDIHDLESRAAVHMPQLLFYAYLVSRLYRQPHVRASLVFIRHPDAPLHYDLSEEHFVPFEKTLRSVISRIRSNDFTRQQRVCDGCPYQFGGNCLIPYS